MRLTSYNSACIWDSVWVRLEHEWVRPDCKNMMNAKFVMGRFRLDHFMSDLNWLSSAWVRPECSGQNRLTSFRMSIRLRVWIVWVGFSCQVNFAWSKVILDAFFDRLWLILLIQIEQFPCGSCASNVRKDPNLSNLIPSKQRGWLKPTNTFFCFLWAI